MVDKVLNGILPYKEVRFLQPPRETYAVYFDNVDYYGADKLIGLENHSVRIEVYSEQINNDIEKQIEKRLIDFELEFNKGERVWLNSEQIYMTVYYFDYIEKIKEEK